MNEEMWNFISVVKQYSIIFRWHNHLNPDIKKDAWTLEEELALMNAHRLHGNKWAEIARVLPGRYSFLFI